MLIFPTVHEYGLLPSSTLTSITALSIPKKYINVMNLDESWWIYYNICLIIFDFWVIYPPVNKHMENPPWNVDNFQGQNHGICRKAKGLQVEFPHPRDVKISQDLRGKMGVLWGIQQVFSNGIEYHWCLMRFHDAYIVWFVEFTIQYHHFSYDFISL